MNPVEHIAKAVLYEGFLLYPYRHSALKNRQRWNFGVLFPPNYSGVKSGSEACSMQTECLIEGNEQTTLDLRVSFLEHAPDATVEREVRARDLTCERLLNNGGKRVFLPRQEEAAQDATLSVRAEISLQSLAPEIFKLTVRIENESPFCGEGRDEALRHSLISTHALLSLRDGRFHSLTDPPERLQSFARQCRNIGAWPVLVGDEGSANQMLAAPIILGDYPKVAPQSPGDFFDGTEIDEMLSLRILTLTEAEKSQMRQAGERGRRLLERTEALPEDELLALHGVTHLKNEVPFQRGDRVRLRPKRRADAFDLLLTGKTATVLSVEQTLEDEAYLCVTVEDDPGKDFGSEGKIGHRFFFRPDEVERL